MLPQSKIHLPTTRTNTAMFKMFKWADRLEVRKRRYHSRPSPTYSFLNFFSLIDPAAPPSDPFADKNDSFSNVEDLGTSKLGGGGGDGEHSRSRQHKHGRRHRRHRNDNQV